ncbi:MAG: TonB-dependent receptor [Tenuifilaceae bacterium]
MPTYCYSIIKLKTVFLSFFIFTFLNTYSQEGRIVIQDSKTKETIPFAHVCFEEIGSKNKQYLVSDKDGIVINNCKNKSVIAVSYVGYQTYIDTITPIKNYKIDLLPHIFDLDQVVVTASFTPQKADQSIYNVKVIDARAIQQRAATNLSDVLKDEVNIQVTHDPALGSGLKLKGLSGNNVKILVDGVPVIGRMGGNIDISQLNLYNIDHVEVVEGPLSVVYGSNALAGAINIITKENLHSTYTASVNTYLESAGTYNFDGGVSTKKGKNSFSLSGGRNFFGGVYLPNDENRSQLWKPKEQYNADFYYAHTTSKSKIKYQTSFMNERLLDKGDQLAPSFVNAQDIWFNTQKLTNRIEFNNKINSDYFLNMVGSHSFYKRERLTYLKDFLESTSTLINDPSANDTSYYNSIAYRAIFGNQNPERKLSFLAGVDLNYEIATGERILLDKQKIGDYAVFTSFMFNASKNLSIQPGFRYAYNTKFDVPLVPSVNIKWKALSFLNIRASYARGYRAPTLKELYILFKDINHDIRPNENLKAEYAHNFDLSFNINTNKDDKIHFSNIEVNLFYNMMSNNIYLAPTIIANNTGVYNYINISNLNTLGGRISFKYSFYPEFDFGVAVGQTGMFASFTEKNQSLDKYKFSPEANLSMSLLIPRIDVKISTNYKYTGRTFNFNIADANQIVNGEMDSYNNLDISLLKKLFSNKVTFSLGVKNIFNNTLIKSTMSSAGVQHSDADGSPVGYGRVYYTSLSYNIFK